MKNQERPSLFVGWVHKGRKSFEVIPESQYGALLKKLLLEKHVHPGAIFISKMTICHWISPNYHKGCNGVSVYSFWDEINNLNSPDAYYTEPKLKKSQSHLMTSMDISVRTADTFTVSTLVTPLLSVKLLASLKISKTHNSTYTIMDGCAYITTHTKMDSMQ